MKANREKPTLIRKLKAWYRLLTARGYILTTITKPEAPFYDHTVCEEDVLHYNGFINSLYEGNQDALRQAKELLER